MSEIEINLTPEFYTNILQSFMLNVEKIKSVSRHHRKLTFSLSLCVGFVVFKIFTGHNIWCKVCK